MSVESKYYKGAIGRPTGDSVRLQRLVDVDFDAGVRTGVRAREADGRGLRAATTRDLELGALHLHMQPEDM